MPRTPPPATIDLHEEARVRLPVRWIASIAAALVAVGGVLTLVRLHADDGIRHLDAKAVQAKGGPVYREDLRDVRDSLDQRIRQESEATRAVIREKAPAAAPLRFRCRSVGGGAMQCEAGGT